MILVFGKTGQVARALASRPDVTALGRREADLTDPGGCVDAITRHAPDAVINAAAYTAVDLAETEGDLAEAINAAAPGAMAQACAAQGIPFVHLSTDYVFDGSANAPWRPGDTPSPINAYGRSKLSGEMAVKRAGGVHAILRTSWVFSDQGRNFVTTMLSLAQSREQLSIVADQIGGPTYATDIADACYKIAQSLQSAPHLAGTYHFSGAPDVSWAEFAREIFRLAGCSVTVNEIETSAYPTPARRPLNSRLDCTDLARFGLGRPDWKTGLQRVIETTKVSQ